MHHRPDFRVCQHGREVERRGGVHQHHHRQLGRCRDLLDQRGLCGGQRDAQRIRALLDERAAVRLLEGGSDCDHNRPRRLGHRDSSADLRLIFGAAPAHLPGAALSSGRCGRDSCNGSEGSGLNGGGGSSIGAHPGGSHCLDLATVRHRLDHLGSGARTRPAAQARVKSGQRTHSRHSFCTHAREFREVASVLRPVVASGLPREGLRRANHSNGPDGGSVERQGGVGVLEQRGGLGHPVERERPAVSQDADAQDRCQRACRRCLRPHSHTPPSHSALTAPRAIGPRTGRGRCRSRWPG